MKSGLLFLGVLAVYLLTLCPTVGGGDSAELTLAAQNLGVAHPPGYPLFSLLGHLFSWLPLKSVAWRVNLFSAFCDAGAAVLIFRTVARLNAWAGLAAGALFAFSPLVWSYATVAEVFPLNNLLVATLFYLVSRYHEAPSDRLARAGALCIGLGMSNHHVFALFAIPCLVSVLASATGRKLLQPSKLAALFALFLAGLLPYAYLPFASARALPTDWGDLTSLAGFFRHWLRSDYGTFSLAKADLSGGGSAWDRFGIYLASLPAELSWVGLPLAAFGIPRTLKPGPGKKFGVCLLFSFAAYVVVIAALANLRLDLPLFRRIFARFGQQANIPVFLWAGFGAAAVLERWKLPAAVLAAPVLLQLALGFRSHDLSRDWALRDFSRAVLEAVPKGSLLVSSGDHITASLLYFQKNEGWGAGIPVVELFHLRNAWYRRAIQRHLPAVAYPDLPTGPTLLQFFSANASRSRIFVVNGFRTTDTSYQESFTAWPVGELEELLPNGASPGFEDWLRASEASFKAFTPPPPEEFGADTWEHDLYRLHWRQRYSFAARMTAWSLEHGSDRRAAELALHAYGEVLPHLLGAPIELFKDSFDFFKNRGLAYEALSRYEPKAREGMVAAWKEYLLRAPPTDQDYALIRARVGGT